MRLIVRGRVQGVGFRYFVRQKARALGLQGVVRNRQDAAVEIEASGPRAALDQLIAAVRIGPPGAQVEGVETSTIAVAPHGPGFRIEAGRR